MITGSCCCGIVQFEITEKPDMMGTCHCSRCRKSGAGTLVFVTSDSFRLTHGQAHITVFKARPPWQYDRCFCSVCGSALGEVTSKADSFPVAANCIDTPIDIENRFHEFVLDKPDWLKIGDDAVQFDEHPME